MNPLEKWYQELPLQSNFILIWFISTFWVAIFHLIPTSAALLLPFKTSLPEDLPRTQQGKRTSIFFRAFLVLLALSAAMKCSKSRLGSRNGVYLDCPRALGNAGMCSGSPSPPGAHWAAPPCGTRSGWAPWAERSRSDPPGIPASPHRAPSAPWPSSWQSAPPPPWETKRQCCFS